MSLEDDSALKFRSRVVDWLADELSLDSAQSIDNATDFDRNFDRFCKTPSSRNALKHLISHVRSEARVLKVKQSISLLDVKQENRDKAELLQESEGELKILNVRVRELRQKRVHLQHQLTAKTLQASVQLDQDMDSKLNVVAFQMADNTINNRQELMNNLRNDADSCNKRFNNKLLIKDDFANPEYLSCCQEVEQLVRDSSAIYEKDDAQLEKLRVEVLRLHNCYPSTYLTSAITRVSHNRASHNVAINGAGDTDNTPLTCDAFEILKRSWREKVAQTRNECDIIEELSNSAENDAKIAGNMMTSARGLMQQKFSCDSSVLLMLKMAQLDKLVEVEGLNAYLASMNSEVAEMAEWVRKQLQTEINYDNLVKEVKRTEREMEENRAAIAGSAKRNASLRHKISKMSDRSPVLHQIDELKNKLANLGDQIEQTTHDMDKELKLCEQKDVSPLFTCRVGKDVVLPVKMLWMRRVHDNLPYQDFARAFDLPPTVLPSDLRREWADLCYYSNQGGLWIRCVERCFQLTPHTVQRSKRLVEKWNAEKTRQLTKYGPVMEKIRKFLNLVEREEGELRNEANNWTTQPARLTIPWILPGQCDITPLFPK